MKETRNISLTIDKAKKWYNSGNEALKEAALQAFSKEELEFFYKNIKTFTDVLHQCSKTRLTEFTETLNHLNENQRALAKLSLIREVLNKRQEIKAFEGVIYYPYNPLIIPNSSHYKAEIDSGQIRKIADIIIENEKFILLGASAIAGGFWGFSAFSSNCGVSDANTTAKFLGCATEEIAKHMSLYFAKEIFDAKYKGWLNYEWL